MDEWLTYPLGKCLDALLDYRGKSPPKSAEGIPVLSAKVVKTSGLVRPIEQKIAPDFYPKWMVRGLPKVGDVVLTTEGPMGEVMQLDQETVKYALGQRLVCLRGKAGVLDNSFLRYLLVSPAQQSVLSSYATGTTVLGISQAALRSAPIRFPKEIKTQRNIAAVLAALDDKIELNRRMNETLEGMAQAIFKDWFVDFGPTRRKLAGITDPVAVMGGLTPDAARATELAALFPDALGDDGLPVGWSEKPIEHSLVLQRGFDLPKTTRTDGNYPVIAASGPSGTHNEFKVRGPGVCTGRSGVLGGIFFVREDFWPLNTSLWIKEYPNATPLYAYYLLRTLDLITLNGGSAVPTLNRNHVHQIPVVTPLMAPVGEFEKLATLLYDRMGSADDESRALAETRDYLLPKLMSGEIRVRDAEKLAQGAAA
jgi:type I restriction enzyme S subunit